MKQQTASDVLYQKVWRKSIPQLSRCIPGPRGYADWSKETTSRAAAVIGITNWLSFDNLLPFSEIYLSSVQTGELKGDMVRITIFTSLWGH